MYWFEPNAHWLSKGERMIVTATPKNAVKRTILLVTDIVSENLS